MRSFSIDLTATTVHPARIVSFTRLDGFELNIAEAEESILVGVGDLFVLFDPLPGCEISAIKHVINGEMPSAEINFAHSVGGVIDTTEVNEGFWDGARVQIYIIDRSDSSPQLGDPLFTGTIQPVTLDPVGGRGTFDLRGLAVQAESFVQTYQPMCRTDLFSSLCQLNPATFENLVIIDAIIDKFTFTLVDNFIPTPPVDNFYNGGVCISASGFKFEMAGWTQSTLRIKTYLPICVSRLTAGEVLTIYPGCDKTPDTCKDKFNNKINFQGEDHFLGVNSIVGV